MGVAQWPEDGGAGMETSPSPTCPGSEALEQAALGPGGEASITADDSLRSLAWCRLWESNSDMKRFLVVKSQLEGLHGAGGEGGGTETNVQSVIIRKWQNGGAGGCVSCAHRPELRLVSDQGWEAIMLPGPAHLSPQPLGPS
jgi:hypothetical protein